MTRPNSGPSPRRPHGSLAGAPSIDRRLAWSTVAVLAVASLIAVASYPLVALAAVTGTISGTAMWWGRQVTTTDGSDSSASGQSRYLSRQTQREQSAVPASGSDPADAATADAAPSPADACCPACA